MSYGNGNEDVMIKSEILGLKDMNPALQGMILKLAPHQYLAKSNFSVSQIKWEKRSAELNETTVHMLIDNIIRYNSTQKSDRYNTYAYALRILTTNIKYNKDHLNKLIGASLLIPMLNNGLITIDRLDAEMQNSLIDNMISKTVREYKVKDDDGDYRGGGLRGGGSSAIVRGLTMELYERLKNGAEQACSKFRGKRAETFRDSVITRDIQEDILNDAHCALNIVEKHGKPLMSELLLRLRTNQELSLEHLPVGEYKEDWDSPHAKVRGHIKDIMSYDACPVEYLRKIMNCAGIGDEKEIQEQLLDLEREDLILLQLQLMLNKQLFKQCWGSSFHGRQVFWTRFEQLLNGKPEFMDSMRSMMLDAGTMDLPKSKGNFND